MSETGKREVEMTKAEILKAAKAIRAGADPRPYQVDGILPDPILDAIVDLSLAGK